MFLLQKVAVSLLLLMITSPSFAQNLWTHPDNAWTYSDFVQGPRGGESPVRMVSDRDTVYNGIEARILKVDRYLEFMGGDEIIIYADADKLYAVVDSSFRAIYDFSLAVGDNFDFYVGKRSRVDPITNEFAQFRVDSTKIIVLNSVNIRAQYLSQTGGQNGANSLQGWNYEYIGNISGFYLPYSTLICDGGCITGVRCFTNRDNLDINLVNYPCDTSFTVSAKNPDFSKAITLFPNPLVSGSRFELRLPTQLPYRDVDLSIYNANGSLLLTRSGLLPGAKISFPEVVAGVYYVAVETPEGRAVKKVFVK